MSGNRKRVPEFGDLLSDREVEILDSIIGGLTVKQTARQLGVTHKTVHNHLNSVYRKLGVSSLTHAVLAALRFGDVSLDDPPTNNTNNT